MSGRCSHRVWCAPCLARLARPTLARRLRLAALGRLSLALLGFFVLWMFFYFGGRLLLTLPASFHEGTYLELLAPDEGGS